MRRLHFALFAIGILVVALTAINPSVVKATSVYDNVLSTTPSINAACYWDTDVTTDLTNIWYSKLQELTSTSSTYYQNALTQLDDNIANNESGWAVLQSFTTTEDTLAASILIYDPDVVTPQFKMIGSNPVLNFDALEFGTNAWALSISYADSGCDNFSIGSHVPGGFIQGFPGLHTDGSFAGYPKFLFLADTIEYPVGYEGEVIFDGSEDADGDGLTLIQELQQGTIDAINYTDTDKDGLSDLVESVWYTGRADVFCNTAPTPDVCTYPDPKKKDLYLEMDWLKDVHNNVFKPTNPQFALLETMYDNYDINLHIDSGDFGGGNEISTTSGILSRTSASGVVDYWDFRYGGGGSQSRFQMIGMGFGGMQSVDIITRKIHCRVAGL